MYSLIGSTDDNPNEMSQLQYLRFVKDAQIREHLPDVPPRERRGVGRRLRFGRANREEARVSRPESQGLGDPLAKKKSNATSSADGGSPGGAGGGDDNPDGELLQHEFVSAIVRRTFGTRTARGSTARRRRSIRSRRRSR